MLTRLEKRFVDFLEADGILRLEPGESIKDIFIRFIPCTPDTEVTNLEYLTCIATTHRLIRLSGKKTASVSEYYTNIACLKTGRERRWWENGSEKVVTVNIHTVCGDSYGWYIGKKDYTEEIKRFLRHIKNYIRDAHSKNQNREAANEEVV